MQILKDKLKVLPDLPGVYLMRDEEDNILYIGKARSLRKRVSQYFSSYGSVNNKVAALMSRVYDFNYIITLSEVDALMLESNLIKKHKPYYNILLKDDKSYPFIRIDIKSDFPPIEITRKVTDDGALYFGPYMQGISAREIMELIYSSFSLRSCNHNISSLTKSHRPCLNYHIKRCLSPCTGKVSAERYKEILKRVIAFLKGNDKTVMKILNDRMIKAAEKEEYETALYYKERINTLDKIVRKQISYLTKDCNLDVFGIADNGIYSVVNMLIVRGGKLVGSENTVLNSASLGESNALSEYILEHYRITPFIADEIIVSVKIEDMDAIMKFWEETYHKKVDLMYPLRGSKRQLADMADNNAKDYLIHYTEEQEKIHRVTLGALKQLQEHLSLSALRRVEAYDISNISGTNKVASMVVFIDGNKAIKHYRRFKIKTVEGSDDFASLRETIKRRFARYKEAKDESFKELPDLIIIDGGLGQLSSSLTAMREEGYDVPMIGLAKKEELIIREKLPPLSLPRNSLALHFLERIRDEAHRFAVTYHRLLRNKKQIESSLLAIEDLGKGRIKSLFDRFKTLDKIKAASVAELMTVKGIGRETADKIYKHFRSN